MRPSGLLTDLDGTVSSIASRPEDATVHPAAAAALERLLLRADLVAVISGRSVRQLESMIGAAGVVMVGNHGLEWQEKGERFLLPDVLPHLDSMREAVAWLRRELDLPGAIIEDKGASASIHYRMTRDTDAARHAILRALRDCGEVRGLRVTEGKMVVNLLPPVLSDKGGAVARLIGERSLVSVVYLGDDVTDMDAFSTLISLRSARKLDAVLIAVASPEAPVELVRAADFVLAGVDESVRFLEELAGRLPETASGLSAFEPE